MPVLVHVCDDEPGIERHGHSRFRYVRQTTRRQVRSDRDLVRIRALAIPPAWTDVWICADPNGHVQATGRDARGRKQYRYHPAYRQRRERKKSDQLVPFGQSLSELRAAVDRDLRRPRQPVIRAHHPALLGAIAHITSTDVNAYLRDISGLDATAKTFRTWGATLMAADLLADLEPPASPRVATRIVNETLREVATELGNTLAVCKASYVHPAVPESFETVRFTMHGTRVRRALEIA
jgi:DNA topoisomerase IB